MSPEPESSRRLEINRLCLGRLALPFAVLVGSHGFSAAFDEYVALERVLARKTLVAMTTRKGLHSQMDSFVSFEVMIAVEALGTLIAFEGSIVGHGRLLLCMAQEVGHCS